MIPQTVFQGAGATVPPLAVTRAGAVEAPLSFLVDTGERPAAYIPEVGQGDVHRTGTYAPVTVAIENGRPRAAELSLDREGFALIRHETAVTDFLDAEAVKAFYYPEVEAAVKAATGAAEVLVFDHNVRVDGEIGEGIRTPVRQVHNDYTEISGPQRVRDLLPPAEAEARLGKRVAIVNLWRPIAGPVLRSPLALADAQSIAPEDLKKQDLIYRDRTGEIFNGVHNPDQRWTYFPEMTVDEAILIKGYESLTDGTARFTLHTAFDDPTTPENAPPRRSIEARTLVFFDA